MYILARQGNTRLFEIAIFYFNQKKQQNKTGEGAWGGGGVGMGRTEQTVTQQNLFFKLKS